MVSTLFSELDTGLGSKLDRAFIGQVKAGNPLDVPIETRESFILVGFHSAIMRCFFAYGYGRESETICIALDKGSEITLTGGANKVTVTSSNETNSTRVYKFHVNTL